MSRSPSIPPSTFHPYPPPQLGRICQVRWRNQSTHTEALPSVGGLWTAGILGEQDMWELSVGCMAWPRGISKMSFSLSLKEGVLVSQDCQSNHKLGGLNHRHWLFLSLGGWKLRSGRWHGFLPWFLRQNLPCMCLLACLPWYSLTPDLTQSLTVPSHAVLPLFLFASNFPLFQRHYSYWIKVHPNETHFNFITPVKMLSPNKVRSWGSES